jgi:membrane-associated phospholipid phosphatase
MIDHVAPLPLSLQFVQFLADHRTAYLTHFFLATTFYGGASAYLLIGILIYVAWNKQLAIRLSVLVLSTMVFNDILKIAIKNPRPFIRDGSWHAKWAVSPKDAAALATEYSTPSGHAMGSSAFYSYLFACIHHRTVRVAAVAAIVLIGFSRPYLGVHYGEDILLGWAFGLTMAAVAIRYGDCILTTWNRLSFVRQIAAAVAGSLALWLLAVRLNGGQIAGQPRNVLSYAGFLTGIVVAHPLEMSKVSFDPRSSGVLTKMLRYLLSLGMFLLTLLILEAAFGMIADRSTLGWNLFEYLRMSAAGFVAIFVAPLLFTRIGWAERTTR